MSQILDGLNTSKKIKNTIKEEVTSFVSQGYRAPSLAVVLVGEDPASQTYVKNKIKDCELVGIDATLVSLSTSVTEEELLLEIDKLNNSEIDGFIIQLPLPKHIDQEKMIMAINPTKDIDGFHPENFGKIALEMEGAFLPATPYGVITLLKEYHIPTEGKEVVVLGRSRIVGRPMSILMSQKSDIGNATVTLLHSQSKNIKEHTQKADIIISALGVPNFITEDMVKEGAVIVDVGISRVDDATNPRGYKLVGDVDFEKVELKSSWITPVPGGVGPMTRAMLLVNTMKAYKANQKSE